MRVLQEGMRLADRYSLIRRLGSGGMSEVWLADDLRSDARVALKFAAGDGVSAATDKKLLHSEWSVSSRMMHANVARVFEFHDDPDGAFFSQQYVGEQNIGVLTGKDVAVTLRPIGLLADALRYAHAKGVIHRDIKAANVLLDSRGAPYVIDFGVAKPAGDAAISAGGSDISSSPQQLAGDAADPTDDIFALGVLIHELLTGVPPVRAEAAQLNVTMLDGSLMPQALQALLGDMLANESTRRPDAESVISRLAEAGFAAGAVPAAFLRANTPAEPLVESVESIQPVLRRAAPQTATTTPQEKTDGISAKILYGGLGFAVLLLVLVVFVLPYVVSDGSDTTRNDGTVVQDAETDTSQDGAEDTVAEAPAPQDAAAVKLLTDDALGDLLSQLERLRYRAIERWGGQAYLDAVDVYSEGDQAYVNKNFQAAGDRYREASAMLEPFFGRINDEFEKALAEAQAAFARSDPSEAVRLFDLAVAITPGNQEAEAGLARALNLEAVLTLTSQGRQFETDLELDAAMAAFERALGLDPAWEPATAGIERVRIAIRQLSFAQRMTEGLDALTAGDFPSARAAFEAAKTLDPTSRQPVDGLLQVEQEIKLENIRALEQQANALNSEEQWETSIPVYEDILQIDSDLQFAKEGLVEARQRASLHARLQRLIDQPDNLSDPANIKSATSLLLNVARIDLRGPRLEEQKNELSRLLKRAATPLQVQLVSDNATNVSVFKVGRIGTFSSQELSLRPGVYVAVGNRAGYRDVRIEFRVAPEIEMTPVVIQCEEQI
ncbi:MAG: tetratricopeptide (TPR) repeat protein [Woeseiaceae bacterium]|jgi:tetratricopeptide (TPR) repeat protein